MSYDRKTKFSKNHKKIVLSKVGPRGALRLFRGSRAPKSKNRKNPIFYFFGGGGLRVGGTRPEAYYNIVRHFRQTKLVFGVKGSDWGRPWGVP